jgi:uncharacterized protein
MALFTPTYFTTKVTDINAHLLSKIKVKGIILDIDDTLVPHRHLIPDERVLGWINELKENDIKIILVSNNFKKRVSVFADKTELPYVCMGLKPLTWGIKKAIKALALPKENVIIIGDQIFTDIMGANFIKIRSVLVEPVSKSKTFLLKFKRFFEKPIRKKIKENKSLDLTNLKK